MSDAVIISLIAAVASVLSALIGLLNNRLAKRNEIAISDTRGAMVTLEKNTNSIKDALVKVTGEAARAKGVLEGRAQVIEATANGERGEKG